MAGEQGTSADTLVRLAALLKSGASVRIEGRGSDPKFIYIDARSGRHCRVPFDGPKVRDFAGALELALAFIEEGFGGLDQDSRGGLS